MRQISIQDDFRLRFPGRDAAFADGVEVGMIATLMAFDLSDFSRTVAADNMAQIQVLAARLGYILVPEDGCSSGLVRLNARKRGQRPRLRVVASGPR